MVRQFFGTSNELGRPIVHDTQWLTCLPTTLASHENRPYQKQGSPAAQDSHEACAEINAGSSLLLHETNLIMQGSGGSASACSTSPPSSTGTF